MKTRVSLKYFVNDCRFIRRHSIVGVHVSGLESINLSKNVDMEKNLYVHMNLIEKETFLSLFILRSISATIGSISIEDALLYLKSC